MAIVYLGLGSNLGDRQKNIEEALRLFKEHHITVKKMSSMIETDPIGGPAQGKFLNAVCCVETHLSPAQLLNLILSFEKKLGRVRTVVNAPRTIDIDILLYDRQVIDTVQLTVPHPRMRLRAFVMEPLAEIDSNLARDIMNESYKKH